MGSQGVVEELPKMAPIRTTVMEDVGAVEDPSEAAAVVSAVAADGEECVTPRSEDHVLKPVLVCPPAPRKPRPAKRKLGPPPQGFFTVPGDLSLVFVPLSNPPLTRRRNIRVG